MTEAVQVVETPDVMFKTLAELEREYIRKVLEHHGLNMSQTARTLGIDRRTLYRKISHFGWTIDRGRMTPVLHERERSDGIPRPARLSRTNGATGGASTEGFDG